MIPLLQVYGFFRNGEQFGYEQDELSIGFALQWRCIDTDFYIAVMQSCKGGFRSIGLNVYV